MHKIPPLRKTIPKFKKDICSPLNKRPVFSIKTTLLIVFASLVSSYGFILVPPTISRSTLTHLLNCDHAVFSRLHFKEESDETETIVDNKKDLRLATKNKQHEVPPIIKNTEHHYQKPKIQERRALGSMELFMLPRPVGPNAPTAQDTNAMLSSEDIEKHPKQTKERPPMNHIAAFILTSTPSVNALHQALDNAVRTHPLLRAHISGNGRPRMWLDPIRRMIRWNGWDNDDLHDGDESNAWNGKEEHPLEFVIHAIPKGNDKENGDALISKISPPNYWGGSLKVNNILGSTREDLDAIWQKQFKHDLDSGTVMSVVGKDEGNLWRLELHRLVSPEEDGATNGSLDDDESRPGVPSVLLMTMNHAISDQGSFNLVMDQIFSDIVEIESQKSNAMVVENPAIVQPVPMCLEDSVLGGNTGSGKRNDSFSKRLNLSSILRGPSSSSTKNLREYAIGKAREVMQSPALLPESKKDHRDGTGGSIATPSSILLSGVPIGTEDITDRRSCVQFRTLSPDVTAALIKKSKGRRVPISMTLAAAVAVTCTDFFNDYEEKEKGNEKSRIYKLLQSLDTRRFSGATDPGDTLSCQAGSMDLLVGPLPDFLGKKIRTMNNGVCWTKEEKEEMMDMFWNVAKQSFDQTSSFLKGGNAIEAVRLLDLGMSVCDVGRLVDSYATSSACKGRAWSAGITNVGEYERQNSVVRQDMTDRGSLKAAHGDYEIKEIYYATSHARVGCTFPVGCITVKGRMSCTINPPWPLISEKKSSEFADAFVEILEVISKEDI